MVDPKCPGPVLNPTPGVWVDMPTPKDKDKEKDKGKDKKL